MLNTNLDGDPPLRSRSYLKLVRSLVRIRLFSPSSSKKYLLWLPLGLIVATASSNILGGKNYSHALSNYVIMEPKTKISAMKAIDHFTPLIQEGRDAEPIVVAENIGEELVLEKNTPARTDRRPDAEPVKRTEVIDHTVNEGETISTIASNYDLKIASIQVENPELKDVHKIKPGDIIKIPTDNYKSDYAAKVLAERAPKTSSKTLALANRDVTVRETSAARYDDLGQPSFGRPAGSLGKNGYHNWALDIPPAGGKGIYASTSGVVVNVSGGWNGGYGNMIVIDHGSGWQTLYGHLESFNVSAGERVTQGQLIATMGATGRTYPKGAVHLHFEIRKNGQRLNPIEFVK